MSGQEFQLLDTISSRNIKKLTLRELSLLAEEIRAAIIASVPKTGGHLASNLGVVELTIALHRVFDTPNDAIIWDVGHQCYPHKMITRQGFSLDTLRQSGGISGFPKRSESAYDSADTGHSSTSISLALGMLVARRSGVKVPSEPHQLSKASSSSVQQEAHHGGISATDFSQPLQSSEALPPSAQQKAHQADTGTTDFSQPLQLSKVLAVIGDGALTGGMAFEALNHGGGLGKDLIVIYNDNQMSISPNVGGFAKTSSFRISRWASKLSATKGYRSLRDRAHKLFLRGSWFGRFIDRGARRFKRGLKGVLLQETLFSDLGYEYVGPIDGHSLPALIRALTQVKEFKKPVVVHVLTKKGKGYQPAEEAPDKYHGVSPEVGCAASTGVSPSTGEAAVAFVGASASASLSQPKSATSKQPTFTQVFSDIITAHGHGQPQIFAITAAMTEGTGLSDFARAFPKRFFDVGIAEQHAVTFAAGLALQGLRPVVAVYSSFLQRAIDQVIHDVAIQKLPVVLALDRSGFVGEDGETHQGLFDITLLRGIPGLVLLAPADAYEMRAAFAYACGMVPPKPAKTEPVAVENVVTPPISPNAETQGPVVIRYSKGTCAENLYKARGCDAKDGDVAEPVDEVVGDASEPAVTATASEVSALDAAVTSSQPTELQAKLSECDLSGRFLRRHPQAEHLVIAVGSVANEACRAEEQLLHEGKACDVYSLFVIQPLAKEALQNLMAPYARVLVLEEGMQTGGVGEAILQLAGTHGNGNNGETLPAGMTHTAGAGAAQACTLRAVHNQFVPQGSRQEQLSWFGMDSAAIVAWVKEF